MSELETSIIKAVNEVAPNAPVIEAVEAAVTTATDPTPLNIIADLELAVKLVAEFKARLAGLHPSIANIIKALF